MTAQSRRRSPASGAQSLWSAGPWTLALRRLRRDRTAVAFGVLVGLILLALLAAPLYASEVAGTGPDDNHLTDKVVIDGESTDVVSVEGVPIGPTWEASYFLGADENGRDLMVRLLYGARASLLSVADEDWVRTARAKGLSQRSIVRRHILRNGLIPPVSLWGLDFAHAFGGFALYVEVIFELPGVGAMTANTIGTFDLPPVVALAMYLALVVVLASAIVDIAVAWLDPRIRRPRPST